MLKYSTERRARDKNSHVDLRSVRESYGIVKIYFLFRDIFVLLTILTRIFMKSFREGQ